MSSAQFTRKLLVPKYWFAWFGMGVWFLISQLPYFVLVFLARAFVPVLRLNKKRVLQARVNIQLCFPHLSEVERSALVEGTIFSTSMAMFETGIAWFWPKWRLRRLFSVTGLENLEQVQRDGQGALLLSLHFTTLDIGGAMLGQVTSFSGMYRTHVNAVFDYVQKKRREAYSKNCLMISRNSVRAMVSLLHNGRLLWYAPDRDLGDKNALFVPFFGVPTATLKSTAQIARLGRAKVIPFSQRRLKYGRGYEIVMHPPFENYPTGDEYADARRVNEFMEQEILKCPEQYFWAQQRFKTRPDGEPPLYNQ